LRIFRQSLVVQSSIERVWHFYTSVKHLEVITPKQIDLQIIKTTSETIVQGQEIWVSGKILSNKNKKKNDMAFKDYLLQEI
jgi:ligand-binding SRPBCC domain-containing protein